MENKLHKDCKMGGKSPINWGASNKAPGQSGICIFDEVLLNIKGDIHGCVTILNV